MSGAPDPLYVRARTVLLDVADALKAVHRRQVRGTTPTKPSSRLLVAGRGARRP